MKKTFLFLLLSLACSIDGVAQDSVNPAAIHGTVTAGYRFTDISGRREKYNELFDLRKGFRVHDFTLYNDTDRPNKYFDSFFLTASGLGGEPFSGGQLVVRKNRVYDLRLNYQQSYYYWDRNDDLPNPRGVDGFTSNHDWSTVKKIGSVNFSAYATNRLRFTGEYQRSSRNGMTFSTRTLDYFGAPSSWAGFMRSNPYVVEAPLDLDSNRLTGGINYSSRDWSFAYRTGYQWSDENVSMKNLGPGQRSINIDEARTALELVDVAVWDESRELRTPVSEFTYNGQPSARFRVRGGYIFQRYRGPRSVMGTFEGTARSGSTELPYSVLFHDQSVSREVNHVIDQGFSYEFSPTIAGHVDYRYFRDNVDSVVDFESVTDGSPASGSEETSWKQGTHTLDLAVEFAPLQNFQIRPGVRLTKRDVLHLHEGVADDLASKRSKLVSPMLTVYYSPSRKLMLRGDIRNTTNGTPYTRISPRKDLRVRWVAQYRFSDKLSIENTLSVRNAEFSTTDYRNAIRSNSTHVAYALNNRLSLNGGFTYDSFLATALVAFRRPTPQEATWRDQSIVRVWQAGVEAKPVRKLTLNLSGNYIRNTGVGEISEEPPTFGPLRWPFVTGTATVEVPRGRVSIDLQRTYYIEEIMTGDNFGANMLNIRWTTEF